MCEALDTTRKDVEYVLLPMSPGRTVSFIDYDLGYIDLERRTLQPIDNPFGPRLSPMS